MEKFNFQISQTEFDAFLQNRKLLLPQYEMCELDLQDYVKANPDNQNLSVIEHKVYLLNRIYHTRVPRKAMAKHIFDINVDDSLKKGDPNLVLKIAKIGKMDKTYYSFATKYCAMHKPDEYPIHDRLVWSFFLYLGEKHFFSPETYALLKSAKNDDKRYTNYKHLYDEFIDKSGIKRNISYRQVDKYIWGYFQVYIFYHGHEKEASNMFSDIFKGIISCALWEIIKQIVLN